MQKRQVEILLIAVLAVLMLGTASGFAATVSWDVASGYGTTGAAMQAAVNDAISHRISNPDDTIILDLAAGAFTLEEEINIDGLPAGGTGWLIIQGQGIGVTELIDTDYAGDNANTFDAQQPHRLEMKNFSLTGALLTNTQGTCVNLSSTFVDIDLDPGFPLPTDLWETDTTKANKMRLMNDEDPNNPHYVEGPGNDHYSYRIAWQGYADGTGPVQLYDRVWRFYTNEVPPYQVGDRLAISSKSDMSNWGIFPGPGSDVVFENIELKRLGRIKFRQQWDGIRFTNVKIVRHDVNGITALYSTDAGPQLGHDADGGENINVIMENCDFRGTTDDGSAFQRVTSGYATNNRWEDGGGTLVGINCGPGFVFSNNTHYHCPLEDNRPGGIDYKGAYDFSPANHTNGVLDPATLSWTVGSNGESHDIYFGTTNPPPFVGNQTLAIYEPNMLLPGATYYWRINEVNSLLGSNKGDLLRFTTSIAPCDLNTDGDINFEDFEIIAWYWLSPCLTPNWCVGTNLNKSGLVDLQDLNIFTQCWLGIP
jgi:hypothetical protein